MLQSGVMGWAKRSVLQSGVMGWAKRSVSQSGAMGRGRDTPPGLADSRTGLNRWFALPPVRGTRQKDRSASR